MLIYLRPMLTGSIYTSNKVKALHFKLSLINFLTIALYIYIYIYIYYILYITFTHEYIYLFQEKKSIWFRFWLIESKCNFTNGIL